MFYLGKVVEIALAKVGRTEKAIRTQEVGDYWRERGQDFCIAKKFDITLAEFKQIDDIIRNVDTKGINTMRIGELKNKEILVYHEQGKIKALQAAQRKASYLLEAFGLRVVCIKNLPFFHHGAFREVGTRIFFC